MARHIKHNDCVHCERQSYLFKHLKRSELELINANRHEVIYNPGEIIFKQGSPSTHAISFTFGLAKVYIENDRGEDALVKFVKPVEFNSGPGFFVGNRHHYTISTIDKSYVCVIDKNSLKSVMRTNPEFTEAYFTKVNESYLYALERLSSHICKHARGRVAETILHLAESIYGSNPFKMTISIQDMAQFCGISKSAVSIALKEFVNDSLISIENKMLTIIDMEMMNRVSING